MDTILFLHGWGGDQNSFSNIMPYLQRTHRCLSISMPTVPSDVWQLEDYALMVEKFLDDARVEQCHIIAHSFGARVAVLLVNRNPQRFKKLVLTGAAGIRKKLSLYRRFRIWLHKRGIWKSLGSPDYQNLSRIGKLTFQNIVNRDLSRDITKISHPTLLVFGKRDKSTPVWMGKRWARLSPNAKLLIYKNSGHFAYLDEPSRFLVDTTNSLS